VRGATILLLAGTGGALAYLWWRDSVAGAAESDQGEGLLDMAGAALGLTARGYRNNNPGNLRFLTSNAWNGQIANDGGYAVYDSKQNGTRALGRQLLAYAKRGQNTVRLILAGDPQRGLYGWAPPNENNTEAYIDDVAGQLEVEPNQPISVQQRLPDLGRAIAKHENGYVDNSFDWSWVYL
jgi:hypothetical protein